MKIILIIMLICYLVWLDNAPNYPNQKLKKPNILAQGRVGRKESETVLLYTYKGWAFQAKTLFDIHRELFDNASKTGPQLS